MKSEPAAEPAPQPGTPVRGSVTGRPLMAALDLFGRRWVLRILWELQGGPLGFRPLQRSCDGMSSSVLWQRLAELEQVALIQRVEDGRYSLTPLGHDLNRAIMPLQTWSVRWASALGEGPR
ncbi:MAG TPA: helix-turn-helix domain-containing protein [Micromonosporaceae bacterium]